jgi:hypothetical protein
VLNDIKDASRAQHIALDLVASEPGHGAYHLLASQALAASKGAVEDTFYHAHLAAQLLPMDTKAARHFETGTSLLQYH